MIREIAMIGKPKMFCFNFWRPLTRPHIWHFCLTGRKKSTCHYDIHISTLILDYFGPYLMKICIKNYTTTVSKYNFFFKMCRTVFLEKSNHVSFEKILLLIHADVCSPMQTKTPSGQKYFVTFIDDNSCLTDTF